MTREELDFIGSMNMCDEISNEAYKKIVCHCREQDPCEDAISRTEAVKICKERGHDNSAFYISQLSSVIPQPKTGYWIEEFNDLDGEVRFTCSSCGKYQLFGTDYCYNCGAKMIEPQENKRCI